MVRKGGGKREWVFPYVCFFVLKLWENVYLNQLIIYIIYKGTCYSMICVWDMPCAGELDGIQIDVSTFAPGSTNVLVVSFTKNGLTAQQTLTFSGRYLIC